MRFLQGAVYMKDKSKRWVAQVLINGKRIVKSLVDRKGATTFLLNLSQSA